MTISFSGLASGLDTSSWVESLTALKQAKVTSLKEEKETVLLSKDTLNSIKQFFASFRSVIEKVTDTRFNIVSMDLFAQNIATSANLNVLTATATSEAEEGVYNVKVDKLASNTQAVSNYSYLTTIVQTTTATSDSKLVHLGVNAGNILVTSNGIEYGIELTNTDTIATFIEKLQNIGVEANYNEQTGIFTMNLDDSAINDIGNTNIVDALHLDGVNEGYVTENRLQVEREETVYTSASSGTKLSDLGVSAGTITVHANDQDYSITITDESTLGTFITDLNNNNIDATLDATGVFTLTDAEITDEDTTNILDALGLEVDIYSKSQKSDSLLHETVVTETTTATSATLLKDIGEGTAIADDSTVIVKNSNNEYTTITVGTATTIGELLGEMTNAGLSAQINTDGTVEIAGGSITGGTFDAVSALGLESEPYSAMVTGDSLTEVIEVAEIVTLETELVGDLKVSKGYLEVTDADGNVYYEKIYSGQTIADFMADMGNLGIYTSLDTDTGVLSITGGAFRTLEDDEVQDLVNTGVIVESDANYIKGTDLLECLYGSDVIETDQIEVASTYSRTRALTYSVTNLVNATLDTTLETLGLTTEGTATFDTRGEEVTIDVTKDMTVQGLINALTAEGLAASWDSDTSRLSINNATITGGTSDLADVLNMSTTIAGKYVTSTALYSSTTSLIDATRETVLGDYGITNSMSESDRTVNLYDSDGNLLASTVVTEATKIGDLLDFASDNGVTATISSGVITFNDGYIENATLETFMGLESSNASSFVLGSIMTTTTTVTVTGDSKLSDIISTLGTEDEVSGGYNLSFNSQELAVSADTTLNELMDLVQNAGGIAYLDATGRLHIDGGTLTGTVAEALGVTSTTVTSSVGATGNSLTTKVEVAADLDTTFGQLGVSGNFTILDKEGNAVATNIYVNSNATLGSFIEFLSTYGIEATLADGVLSLNSLNGNYIIGPPATALGIETATTTQTVNTTMSSTLAVKHTEVVTADGMTTLGELGLTDTDEIEIYSSSGFALATLTVDTTQTVDELFGELETYSINGTITNGVINLHSSNGNYIQGSAANKLEIGLYTLTAGATAGITMTSSEALTYTLASGGTAADLDTKLSDIDGCRIGNITIIDTATGESYATIEVDDTTTVESLINSLESYGVKYTTVTDASSTYLTLDPTSTDTYVATGEVLQSIGITTNSVTVSNTLSAETTFDLSYYVNNSPATADTKIMDLVGAYSGTLGMVAVSYVNGNSTIKVNTTTITYDTTIGEFVNWVNTTCGGDELMLETDANGNLRIVDTGYSTYFLRAATGCNVLEVLGLTLNETNIITTVANSATSTEAITYVTTETVTGTLSTTTVATTQTGRELNTYYFTNLAGKTTTALTSTGSLASTSTNYVAISTVDDLIAIQNGVAGGNTYSGKIFVLQNDIVITASDTDFTGIGTSSNGFAGTFDGQGHTITVEVGTNRTDKSSYGTTIGGLFNYINGATIRNLSLEADFERRTVISSGSETLGGLVGYATGINTIENVHVDIGSTCVINWKRFGGLIGTTCTATVNATNVYVEGFGYADGSTSSSHYLGGLIGYALNYSTISINQTYVDVSLASGTNYIRNALLNYVNVTTSSISYNNVVVNSDTGVSEGLDQNGVYDLSESAGSVVAQMTTLGFSTLIWDTTSGNTPILLTSQRDIGKPITNSTAFSVLTGTTNTGYIYIRGKDSSNTVATVTVSYTTTMEQIAYRLNQAGVTAKWDNDEQCFIVGDESDEYFIGGSNTITINGTGTTTLSYLGLEAGLGNTYTTKTESTLGYYSGTEYVATFITLSNDNLIYKHTEDKSSIIATMTVKATTTLDDIATFMDGTYDESIGAFSFENTDYFYEGQVLSDLGISWNYEAYRDDSTNIQYTNAGTWYNTVFAKATEQVEVDNIAKTSTNMTRLGVTEAQQILLSNGNVVNINLGHAISYITYTLGAEGVTASYDTVTGKLTIGSADDEVYVVGMTAGLAEALNIEVKDGTTYKTQVENIKYNGENFINTTGTLAVSGTLEIRGSAPAATEDTKLFDIAGVNLSDSSSEASRTVTLVSGSTTITTVCTSATTINDLIAFSDGYLATTVNADGTMQILSNISGLSTKTYMSGTILDQLGLSLNSISSGTYTYGNTATSSEAVKYYVTTTVDATYTVTRAVITTTGSIVYNDTVTATGDTTIADIAGDDTAQWDIHTSNGSLSLTGDTTMDSIVQQLGSLGVTAAFDEETGFTFGMPSDTAYIVGFNTDAANIFGFDENATGLTTVVTASYEGYALGTDKLSDYIDINDFFNPAVQAYYESNNIALILSTGSIAGSGTYIALNRSNIGYLKTGLENGNNYAGYTFFLEEDILIEDFWSSETGGFGTSDTAFAGIFDGCGYSINAYSCNVIDSSNTDACFGIFNYTDGATIKNVILSGNNYYYGIGVYSDVAAVGALIGQAVGTTISHSYTDITLDLRNNFSGYAGGLVGQGSVIMKNCLSRTNFNVISSSATIGGLIGDLGGSASRVIKNIFDGNITDDNGLASVGSFVGKLSNVGQFANNISTHSSYAISTSTVSTGGTVGVALDNLLGVMNSADFSRDYWDLDSAMPALYFDNDILYYWIGDSDNVYSLSSNNKTITTSTTIDELASMLGGTYDESTGAIIITNSSRKYTGKILQDLGINIKLVDSEYTLNGTYYLSAFVKEFYIEEYTATSETTLSDFGITSNQTITFSDSTLTISSTDTIGTIIDALEAKGISASYDESTNKLSIGDAEDTDYIESISADLKNALNITVGKNYTYKTGSGQSYYNGDTYINKNGVLAVSSTLYENDATFTITTATTMAELGFDVGETGTIVYYDGTERKVMTVEADTTFGEIASALNLSISADGTVATKASGESSYIINMSNNLQEIFEIAGVGDGFTYNVTEETTYSMSDSYNLVTELSSTVVTATTATTMGTLGMTAQGTMIFKAVDGSSTITVTIDTTDSIDGVITKLADYITMSFDTATATATLTSNADYYLANASYNVIDALNLQGVGEDFSYEVTDATKYVNTNSKQIEFENSNVLISGDTIIGSINGFDNGNGNLLVHQANGQFVTISVDATKTLDEFFTSIAQYGLVGSVDSQGMVTISGVGNVYLQSATDGTNLLSALNLSNLITSVVTVTVNTTSDNLSKTVTTVATGATALGELGNSLGETITFDGTDSASLVISTTSNAGNQLATLTFTKTQSLYDVIDTLAGYGITATIDSTGRFSLNSTSLTDFDLSGEIGEFLMGAYTKQYGESSVNNVTTNLIQQNIINMADSTLLSAFGITQGDILITQQGVNYTVAIDGTIQNVGDFRNLLASYGFNSYIDGNGALAVMGIGNSSLSNIAGGSNILDVFGLTDWTSGRITQTSNHLGDTTEGSNSINMQTQLKDLTDASMNPLGITSGSLYVYQDGTRNLINIDANDTLETLATKLSQYGITMGLTQDGVLYFDGNNNSYLTTDGLASGTATNLLTKLNIASWSTRYNSTSETLDYEEDEDTVANGDTLLSDLQDSDGNNLGITTGTYYVYSNGVRNTETITEDTTVNDFVSTMATYGMTTSFNSDGSISVGANGNTYLATAVTADDNTNVVDVLFEQWNFTNIYNSNGLTVPTDVIQAVTRETKLADIIEGDEYVDGYITVVKDGVKTNISLSADETIGSLMDELAVYGFESTITADGQLIIKGSGDSLLQNYSGTEQASNALDILGVGLDDWVTTNTYESSPVSVITTTTSDISATRDTLLSEFGVTTGEYYIYNNGVKYTALVSSDETVGSLIDTLESFGLAVNLVDTGSGTVLQLVGNGNSYLAESASANASNIVETMFEDAESTYTYSGLQQTSTLVTHYTDATLDTLLSYYDDGVLVAEGDLVVAVNGVESTIKITADETFGTLITKLQALGVEATLSDGQLMIQSGFDVFTISDSSTSSLPATIKLLYNDDLGGYLASTATVEQTITIEEMKTLSVSNYADLDTQMSLLNISNGSLTIYRNGEKATIQIDSNQTFGDLRSLIAARFADVDIKFEDGYLTFFGKTDGVNVEVGSTTDTSNFSAIAGLSNDGSGVVKSARELYCVNGDSIITTAGLFRVDDVTEGTFKIGDAQFTITNSTTLSSIISQINASQEANATAYWDSIDGKLVIKSRTTGSALVNIEAGTSNFTDVMGFTNSEWDGAGNLNVTKINVNAQEIGDNAQFSINGTHYTSTSNTIGSDVSRIKGLTINLKGVSEGGTVEIKVERDKETVANAMSEIVDSYNELIENVDKQIAKGSPLDDESTLRLIRNQIRNLMTGSLAGAGVFKNLDSVGISLEAASANNIQTDNIDRLTFNKDKFLDAFDADRDALKNLLVGTDSNLGILQRVESVVESAVAGATGYFASAEKSYSNQIQRLDDKIQKAQKAVDRYRERLEAKFQAMDLLISQIQSQYSSFLS